MCVCVSVCMVCVCEGVTIKICEGGGYIELMYANVLTQYKCMCTKKSHSQEWSGNVTS